MNGSPSVDDIRRRIPSSYITNFGSSSVFDCIRTSLVDDVSYACSRSFEISSLKKKKTHDEITN